MATVTDVATALAGFGARVVIERDGADRWVDGLHVLQDLDELARVARDAVVVLTRDAAAGLRGYRWEAFLARAADRAVGMLVLPTAAVVVAPRFDPAIGRPAVLTVAPDADLGPVCLAVVRQLAGGDSAAVRRLQQGLDAIVRAEADEQPDPRAAALLLGDTLPDLRLGRPEPDRVAVEGGPDGLTWSVPDRGHPNRAVDAVLLRAMAGVGRGPGDPGGVDASLPSLLTELLVSRAPDTTDLREQARLLGFDAAGRHLVLAVAVDAGSDVLEQLRVLQTLRVVGLRTARTPGARWCWTTHGSTLLLICTWTRDPGADATERGRRSAQDIHRALVERAAPHPVRAGLSRVHAGADGFRQAAAEARSALRPAPGRDRNALRVFDEWGMDQTLLDWYSRDEARDASRRLLAPLLALPAERAETAMSTLQAYLDHQGSIARTAEALFIHRNAVSYRITAVKRLLGRDLVDPDERLALQLACRGRHLLGSGADR